MAGENEIVIPISADITKLIEQINKLTGDVEELKSAGDEAGNEMKKAFSGSAKAAKDLSDEIREVEKSLRKTTDPKAIANLKKYKQELLEEEAAMTKAKNTTVSFRTQAMILRDKLSELAMAGKKNTAEYRNLAVQYARVKDAMHDVNLQGKVMASDTRKFDTFAQAVGGVAAAFSVYQGVMALVGSENKDFQKTMAKVMGAMAIANGVQQIANMLQKESAVMVGLANAANKIGNLLKVQGTAATVAQTAATEADTIATEANTAAKTASKGVIGLVIVAVAALAYGIYKMATQNIEAELIQRKVNDTLEITNKIVEQNNQAYKENTSLLKARNATNQELIREEIANIKVNQRIEWQWITKTQKNWKNLTKEQKEEWKKRVTASGDANKKIEELELSLINRQTQHEIEAQNLRLQNMQDGLEKDIAIIKADYAEKRRLAEGNVNLIKQYNIAEQKAINDTTKKYAQKTESISEFIEETKKLTQAQINQLFYTKDWTKELDKIPDKLDKIKSDNIFVSPQKINDEVEALRMLVNLRLESGKTISEEQELLWKLEEDNELAAIENTQYAEELKDAIRDKYRKKREDAIKAEKTFWDEYGEDITKWTNVATQAIGVLFSAMAVSSDNALTEIDKNFTSQEARYKDMLDRQVISQEEYDKKVSALEKKKAAEEKKIKHDAWERERTAKMIDTVISGTIGAIAQYEAGTSGWVLSALVEALTIAAVGVIAGQKNPYRKGTAQILGGRSHEQGGVSLGQFGEAEQGEFLGILSKRQTSTYGNGLMNLFEGLNKNNKDKVLTGLTDIASNVGFSDTNTNLSVSLNEVKEIKSIEKMMKSGNTSVTYHDGYREEKSKGLIRRVYV